MYLIESTQMHKSQNDPVAARKTKLSRRNIVRRILRKIYYKMLVYTATCTIL